MRYCPKVVVKSHLRIIDVYRSVVLWLKKLAILFTVTFS